MEHNAQLNFVMQQGFREASPRAATQSSSARFIRYPAAAISAITTGAGAAGQQIKRSGLSASSLR
jgi:hypothetical protein